MIAAEDIVIDQIRVRARPHEAQMIVNDLQSSSWSVQPRYDWVFVRNISVKSPKNQIRQFASRAVDRALSHAVDGRLSGAEHSEAVYFQTFHQLLAFLLRDLVHGDALKKWYWQRWVNLLTEPKALAINHLLWDNAEYLPAVCEELADMNLIVEVWQNLSDKTALQLRDKLLRDAQSPYESVDREITPDAGYSGEVSLLAEKKFKRHWVDMSYWIRATATLNPGDGRYQLASIISAIRFCPLLLKKDRLAVQQGFYRFIERFRADISKDKNDASVKRKSPDAIETDENTSSVYDENGKPAIDVTDQGIQHSGTEDKNKEENIEEQYLTRAFGENRNRDGRPDGKVLSESLAEEVVSTEKDSSTAFGTQEPAESETHISGISDQAAFGESHFSEAESSVSESFFKTSSGGLFYLINALNEESIQDLLNKKSDAVHSNGWLWLFDMARRLGAEPDLNLLQFIVDQSDLENIKELIDLPPLVELDEIENILASRYLNQGFWDESLINVPASIVSSASHIDVYFSLESVQLPVRLAGMDVNPGWVAWIGRVVTLHYRDSHDYQQ